MKNGRYFNFRDICDRNLWDTGYLVKKLQGYGILRPLQDDPKLCNAPINVNPVGGGGAGVRARGGDLTNFKIFFIKFPRVGNERSIKSVKKAPTPGEKSKQTIL